MKAIIDGFLKFQKNAFPERVKLFKDLANQQAPKALFISCSNSRLVPELVTQREPGDLFVIRNAGNIVPSYGPAKVVNEARQHADGPSKVTSMVRENGVAQLANIQTHPSVRLALEEGRVTLHGWIYDIETGRIDAFDGSTGTFVSLAENPEVHAVSQPARHVA